MYEHVKMPLICVLWMYQQKNRKMFLLSFFFLSLTNNVTV